MPNTYTKNQVAMKSSFVKVLYQEQVPGIPHTNGTNGLKFQELRDQGKKIVIKLLHFPNQATARQTTNRSTAPTLWQHASLHAGQTSDLGKTKSFAGPSRRIHFKIETARTSQLPIHRAYSHHLAKGGQVRMAKSHSTKSTYSATTVVPVTFHSTEHHKTKLF